MAFTSVTESVMVEEGTFAYNYVTNADIKAGQAVVMVSGLTETVTTPTDDYSLGDAYNSFVGVATYDATSGNRVSVIGPGHKVRGKVADGIGAGANLAVSGQYFKEISLSGSGNKVAISLETIAADSSGKLLLI